MRHILAIAALLLASSAFGAQDGPKRELKFRFAPGETFPMKIEYRMSVTLHQIPELLQGLMGEDPLDLKLDAALDVVVKSVAADGSAELEGAWKSLKAKGHVMANDIDLVHPPAKDAKPAPKRDPAFEGEIQGLLNMEGNLRKLVEKPLALKVDARGRVSVAGDAAQFDGPFRSLGGMSGALPAGAVGPGDAWKDETSIQIPAGASTMDVKIGIESRVDGEEALNGRPCTRLKSKFTVGTPEGFKKDDPSNPLNIQIKTEGGGEGVVLFAHGEGRLARSSSALKVKVSVVLPNPGGGEDLEIKGTVKIDQVNELGGR